MRVLNMQPVSHLGDGASSTLAEFDLQVGPDLRLNGLLLRRTRDGAHAVYPPNARGRRVASFTPTFVSEAVAAATTAYRELSAHEHRFRR